MANFADNTVTILLGNGKGAFTVASGSPFTVGNGPRSLAVGDFNGDGNLDFVVANNKDNSFTILFGDGNGGFPGGEAGPMAAGPDSVAIGDLNGDGNLDVLVANGNAGGGTSGDITLNNTSLLSLATGTELLSSGGQTPTLSLNTSFTDGRYLELTGGTLSGGLLVPTIQTSGNAGIGGSVNVNGNFATNGTLTLSATGTPIKGHISIQVNPIFPALKGGACASANFALGGAADGDTIALGVPAERMSATGTVIYTAWVSAANTVTVQACDVLGTQKVAGTGLIRIDLWKH